MKLRPLVLVLMTGCAPEPTAVTQDTPPGHPLTVAVAQQTLDDSDAGYTGRIMSRARFLRRLQLVLLGRPPSEAEYLAVKMAPSPAAADAEISRIVDASLQSTEFYRQMVKTGHDYLALGPYVAGYSALGYFPGALFAELARCGPTRLHAGKLGVFAGYSSYRGGDHIDEICDDPTAPVATVSPWWAPSTTVEVIGRASTGLRSNGTFDCGVVEPNGRGVVLKDSGDNRCSCGPNLIYCWAAPEGFTATAGIYAGLDDRANTPRRQAFEEGARLFAHLAWHDRPMNDLVTGNYTVAPQQLQFMYVRSARMNSANAALDNLRWWDPMTWTGPADPEHPDVKDPLAWRELVPHTLHPQLLSLTPGDSIASGAAGVSRTYRFDPRVQPGEPDGLPYAGVLTGWGPNGIYPRERLRAARWMEVFACRDFIPPTPEQAATLGVYHRDPAAEGVCQHCHIDLDPAAIFFKRWGHGGDGEVHIAGTGPWRQTATSRRFDPHRRWSRAFLPNTILTPVTEMQLQDNPDSIFIDFQATSTAARFKLFGLDSDGTIGPLGFGKLLVESGTFDRCFVRKMYERFVGGKLDANEDAALVGELVKDFNAGDRKLKPFLRALFRRPEAQRGL